MKLILFRTNGGFDSGLGHLMRCLSLAQAFKSLGCKSIIIANKDSEQIVGKYDIDFIESNKYEENDLILINKIQPDIVVFDSYLADKQYINKLAKKFFLVQFDDNNDIYGEVVADILINGNLHAENLDYISKHGNTLFLLGPKYLVMKPEYWDLKNINEIGMGVLVTTGGSDVHNLMPKFFESLKKLKIPKRFVIGPAFSNVQEKVLVEKIKADPFSQIINRPTSLKEYITKAEIVISASGSTIYEVLTLKKIPIIFTVAQNQQLLAYKLHQEGVLYLGRYYKIDWEKIPLIIQDILNKKDCFCRKLERLFEQFNGKGALRVANIILRRINK